MRYSELEFWTLTLVLAISTFLIRFSFLAFMGNRRPAEGTLRALRFIPASVLSAIVAASVVGSGTGPGTLGDRLGALAVGSVVAWKSNNAIWAMLGGMLTFWALRFLCV